MESIHRFLARLVGAEHALDLTQETFLRAYQRLTVAAPSHDGLVPWLYRIARNLAVNHFRRRRTTTAITPSGNAPHADASLSTPPEAEPVVHIQQTEQRHRIERLVRELPQSFRTAFLLCAIEGFSYEQAAAIEGCSPKTISPRLARARARLRILISDTPKPEKTV